MARRSRTLGARLEGHPARRRLLDVIGRLWGVNQPTLERLAGLTRSAVRHHVYILEDSDLVKRMPLGRELHFFPADAQQAVMDALARVHHRRCWSVLREVVLRPGIRQKELLSRLGMTRSVLRANLRVLAAADLVREVARGHARLYYPGAGAEKHWARVVEADSTCLPVGPRVEGAVDVSATRALAAMVPPSAFST